MSNAPVVSITEELVAELLREFDRNSLCPHLSFELLGAAHNVRCYDCGNELPKSHLKRARIASEKHDELSLALSIILSERAEMQQQLRAAMISVDNCELFRKDAERLDWLSEQGSDTQWMNILRIEMDDYETLRDAVDEIMRQES